MTYKIKFQQRTCHGGFDEQTSIDEQTSSELTRQVVTIHHRTR
jgi:hypothetical protein